MRLLGIKQFLNRLWPHTYPIVEKPMVIFVASYNNHQWVQKNLASIFDQDYKNYRVIYVDDASTDKTADLVEAQIKANDQRGRYTLIRNKERKGGLSNLYEAASLCSDEEILVNLDGDDWLANPQVLKTLNQAYSKRDIWLTHGTLIEYPQNRTEWSQPIPKKIVNKNSFRTFRCPSHLKTFYTWLFKKIRLEDLQYKGDFFPMTWDQAIMFPMMEMAAERHAFISKILYVYNTSNPINDNKVNGSLQRDLEKLIRSMPKYAKL